MEAESPLRDWRPVIAALNNPAAREMFARIVLEDGPSLDPVARTRQHARALALLTSAGLIRPDGEGFALEDRTFAELLAAQQTQRPGVQRFLDEHGRLERYPRNRREQRELLELIADRALRGEQATTEKELNERLKAVTADVAWLRRELVDAGIVERTASGSRYSRALEAGGQSP